MYEIKYVNIGKYQGGYWSLSQDGKVIRNIDVAPQPGDKELQLVKLKFLALYQCGELNWMKKSAACYVSF